MSFGLRDDPMLWLLQADPSQTMYVYRLGANGCPIKPYLSRCAPYGDLLEDLRVIHGGGEFRILIRQGSKMVFRGDVAVERVPNP